MIGRIGENPLPESAPDRAQPVDLISAPVFDAAGEIACTLSLHAFERPLALAEILRLGRRLEQACQTATRAAVRPPSAVPPAMLQQRAYHG